MGLPQADAAVDKERVVELAQAAGHMKRCRAAHAVGGALNQRVKSQRRVDPVLERSIRSLFRPAHTDRLRIFNAFKAANQSR